LIFPFNAGGELQRWSLSSFNAGGGSFNAGVGSFNAGVSLQRWRLRRRTFGIGAGVSKPEVGASTPEVGASTPEASEDLWHWGGSLNAGGCA